MRTASTPSNSVEVRHATDVRVRDATYLCMLFIRWVNGLSGSAVGQYAKISYVLRPSSIASECSYQPAMAVPTSLSATGFCQPPCSKPLSASSSETARRLHDAVQREERANDDLAHGALPSSTGRRHNRRLIGGNSAEARACKPYG